MANKQALRDLQQRLAQRMQAAREAPQAANWLAVECAGLGLLLPLKQSGEIFTPVPLQQVPYTQPWMLGVANLRGGLHTVVDLSAFLGLRGATSLTPAHRLVSINPELGINCALLVDQLLGLRGDEQLQAEPDTAGHPDFAPTRMRDGQGRRWQVLDLDALILHPQFLRIVLN
ncbi:twitching motility protein PilI [Roseateles sp. YR242]|jgi:twitching motility protein PilI|uniref:chemotaxis protein CheW n=1 Tax=unclassified Roseateles TaxID=2626991 RepID=UPI0008BBBB3F|nr:MULTISPECIES: chemotaxis protein CheW [unclassified Roseateles]WAC74888.1 chemotaxis protein CheW [Roseateles sp. SL47]SEK59650.1 twitching motility protein PilI [Roseateles sp. YR242]